MGTDASTRATIGMAGLSTDRLGSADLGYLSSLKSGGAHSLAEDPSRAVSIIKKAVQDVAMAQGRIWGFQKFQIKTSIKALEATKESRQDAKGSIEDVDYIQATSELNRQQVLMQAAMGLLGIANNQSQSVLSLLR